MFTFKSREATGILFAILAYFSFSLLDATQKTLVIYYSIFQLLLIILFTQPPPGWLMWCLPFFVMYQSTKDKMTILVASIFSVLFVINFFICHHSLFNIYKIPFPQFAAALSKISAAWHFA